MTASAGGNILSQDEIDALLNQSGSGGGSGNGGGGGLSADDAQRLAAFYGKAVDSISTVLSTISQKTVDLSVPQVSGLSGAEARTLIPGLKVVCTAPWSEGLPGGFFLMTSEEVAGVLASLMMGEEGRKPEELNEIYLSGVTEALNQMLGSLTNAMTGQLQGLTVVAGMPKVEVSDLTGGEAFPVLAAPAVTKISYKIDIGGLASGELIQLDTVEQTQAILARLKGGTAKPATAAAPAGAPAGGGAAAPGGVNVQPVQFQQFAPQAAQPLPTNLDLLTDVPMRVTVELGRTRMRIKDILNLGAGSIIELDKLAGEPVDLLVNGKLIAKGEVVVIDENFGVRVTDIVPPAQRFNEML